MKNISKINLALVGVALITTSLSCKWFSSADAKKPAAGSTVDFSTPGKALDVKVQLDKKHSAIGKISEDQFRRHGLDPQNTGRKIYPA